MSLPGLVDSPRDSDEKSDGKMKVRPNAVSITDT